VEPEEGSDVKSSDKFNVAGNDEFD